MSKSRGIFKRAKPWCVRAKAGAGQPIEELASIRSSSMLLRWRRRVLVLMWFMVFLAIAIVASMVLVLRPASTPISVEQMVSMTGGTLILAVVFCVLQSGLGQVAKWKLRKRVIQVRGQLCIRCFYDLSARPRNDDTCPECGTLTPRRECVRLWCKLLRSRF